jgi:hypothetical protein
LCFAVAVVALPIDCGGTTHAPGGSVEHESLALLPLLLPLVPPLLLPLPLLPPLELPELLEPEPDDPLDDDPPDDDPPGAPPDVLPPHATAAADRRTSAETTNVRPVDGAILGGLALHEACLGQTAGIPGVCGRDLCRIGPPDTVDVARVTYSTFAGSALHSAVT